MITFKYQFTDIGYCRVCFTIKANKITRYYCLQEQGNTVELFRCSNDWEPQGIVTIKAGIEIKFDVPGDLDGYANNMIIEWKYQRRITNENQNTESTATA